MSNYSKAPKRKDEPSIRTQTTVTYLTDLKLLFSFSFSLHFLWKLLEIMVY